jgi:hypothetical protein
MVLRQHESPWWTSVTVDTVSLSPWTWAGLTSSPADDAPSAYAPPPGAPPSRNDYQSTEEKERAQAGSSYPDHQQSHSPYPGQGQYGQSPQPQLQQQPQPKKGLGGLFDKIKGAAQQQQQQRMGGGYQQGGYVQQGGYGQQGYPQQGYGHQPMMGGYGQQPMMGGGMMGGGYGQQSMMMGQQRRQGMGAGGAVRYPLPNIWQYADKTGGYGCRRRCKLVAFVHTA